MIENPTPPLRVVMVSLDTSHCLAFLAVFREGIELALFLTAATFASDAQQTLFGAILGLFAAVVLGWLMFATTIRLNLRRFFLITGALLILFSAGLVARSVHEFNEVGWIPPVIEHVWDTSFLVSESSTGGRATQGALWI